MAEQRKEIDAAERITLPVDVERHVELRYQVPPLLKIDPKDRTKAEQAAVDEWAKTIVEQTKEVAQEQIARHSKEASADTIVAVAKRFLDAKFAEFEEGAISSDRYASYQRRINQFRDWVGGSKPVDAIDAGCVERYSAQIKGQIKSGVIVSETGWGRWQTFKSFIKWLWEYHIIELPRNLDTRRLSISRGTSTPNPIEEDDLPKLIAFINDAPELMRLYLLLMCNCGYGQGEIANLRQYQVNWEAGRIIRPRSKTKDSGGACPTVN